MPFNLSVGLLLGSSILALISNSLNITSSSIVNNPENTLLAHTLTSNRSVSWTIVGGLDSTRVELSGSTLRWVGNGTRNFESPDDSNTNNRYQVIVRATDAEGNFVEQALTIIVINVFEQPTLSALTLDSSNVIAGNESTINILGRTSGSTIAIISGSIPTGMSLDTSTGEISGIPTGSGSFAFTIRESLADSLNSPRDSNLSINVAAAIVLNNLTGVFSLAENSSENTSAGQLVGVTSGSSLVLLDNAGGRVSLSGTTVVAGNTSLDFEAGQSYGFSVRESITGASNNNRTSNLTLQVTNVLEGPSQSALSLSASEVSQGVNTTLNISGSATGSTVNLQSGSLPEGMTLSGKSIVGTPTTVANYNFVLREIVTDGPDSPRDTSLSISVSAVVDTTAPTITSTNPSGTYPENQAISGTLTANESVTWSVTGNDSSLIALNSSTGAWSVTPDFETKSQYSFNLVATDPSGNNSAQAVTFTITNVFEQPSLLPLSLSSSSVTNGDNVNITINGTRSGSTLSIFSGNLPAGLTLNSGQITGVPTTNQNYVFTLRETLGDSPNSPRDTELSILVEAEADVTAPIITSSDPSGTYPENQNITGTVTANETVTFGVTGTDDASVSINSVTGAWSISSPNFETKSSYSFSLTAQDASGNISPQPVSITISNVFEEPSLLALSLSSSTASLGQPTSISINGRRAGSTIEVTSGSLPSGLTLDSVAGTVAGTSSSIQSANFTVTETLGDSPNSPRSTALSLSIVDTTAPVITSSGSVSVAENTVLAHALTANEPVTWSIQGGVDSSNFEISGSTLRWVGNVTRDFEAPADSNSNNIYILTVIATDASGNATTQEITVTVIDQDEIANAFSFTDVTGVAVSTSQTSNTITVSGLGTGVSVPVTVIGGTYSKNGGSLSSAAGTAINGDTFQVNHDSSSSASTDTNTTLNIGAVSDTFTSTTASAGFTFVNTEAAAYNTALTGTLTDTQKGQVDALVSSLKTAGIWTSIYRLQLYDIPTNQNDALLCLKSATVKGSRINSPTWNASRGFTGDGFSSYIDTGESTNALINQTGVPTEGHLSLWVRDVGPSNAATFMGAWTSSSTRVIMRKTPTGQPMTYSFAGPDTVTGTTNSENATGLLVISRVGSDSFFYRNKTIEATRNATPTEPFSGNLFVLTRNANGPLGNSAAQVSIFTAGSHLTTGERDALHTALNTWRTARDAE